MAVRTVAVRLTATATQYNQTMRQAARTAQQTATRIQTSMNQAQRRAQTSMNQTARRAGTSMNSWAAATQNASRRAGRSVQDFSRRAQASTSRLGARIRAQMALGFGSAVTWSTRASAAVSGFSARASAAVSTFGVRARTAILTGLGPAAPMAARAAAAVTGFAVRASTAVTGFAARARAASSAAFGNMFSTASAAAARVGGAFTAAGVRVGRTFATMGARAATAFAGMAAAARASAASMAGSFRLAAAASAASMMNVANNGQRSLRAVRGASIGLLAAFGLAVFAAARFDKAMSNVGAVASASAQEMQGLRDAALEAGRTTAYSASQAAQAEEELAKAGVAVADIVGGALTGSLNLAAAAQVDLAEAAEIAATSMVVFKLQGRDVGHIADVLAAAANKSATDVHQMGLSLKMTGQVAAQTGLSLEDTVGALTLFAAEGLKGSDAGTSFKVMLQRLTPQSKEAQATMDKLGFSAYDANGQFVGLHEVARRMKDAFSGLTPEARNAAMGVIFGADAVRAASILYKNGEAGVRKYTDAVDDQGYAAAVAAKKMDNLVGDLQYLKSALETALIQSGSAANGALRSMTQWVTRLVNAYNNLPPGLQTAATMTAGLTGALGLAAAGVLLLLPRIMLVRRELVALGLTAARARAGMLLLGRMGLVLLGLAAVNYATNKLMDAFDEAPASIAKLKNSLLDFSRTGKATGEAARILGEDLGDFGDSVQMLAHPTNWERIKNGMEWVRKFGSDSEQLQDATENIEAVDKALAGLVSSGATKQASAAFKQLARRANESGTSTEKFRSLLPQYTDALAEADAQNKITAGSQGKLGDEVAMTADELADQRTEAEKLTDTLNSLNGANISAAEGQIAFRQSLADLTAAVKENGTSLNTNSEKGRAVKSAFLGAAKAAQEHAQKVAEQKNSVAAGNKVLGQNVAALRRTMKAAGFTSAQIDKLIGAYARLPVKKDTKINAKTAFAIKDLQAVQTKIKNTKGKTVTMKAPTKAARHQLELLGFKVKNTKGKRVRITAPTGGARTSVDRLKAAIDRLKDKQVTISISRYFRTYGNTQGMKNALETRAQGGPIGYASGGRVQHFPTGGRVRGPGTATSDSIPIMGSNGEYMIRAKAVRKYGQPFFDELNAMRVPQFASGGIMSGRRFAGSPERAQPGAGPIHAHVTARVYVGDREITDIVRTEVDADFTRLGRALSGGRII